MKFYDYGGKWSHWGSLASATLHAPTQSGVYVIAGRNFTLGLPGTPTWAYVGRSDNLKRRLNEHTAAREKNRGLKQWLAEKNRDLEVWFQKTSPEESRQLEKSLVHGLDPLFNEIRFTGD